MSEDTIAETAEKPAPAAQSAPPLDIPVGTENLLDAQLAEALKIVRDFATWIQAPTADMESCLDVSNRVCGLMTSSARVARASTRARLAARELAEIVRG